MQNRTTLVALLTTLLVTALFSLSGTYAANAEKVVDVQNDEMDVTLFRGAANNSYFPVYFKIYILIHFPRISMRISLCIILYICFSTFYRIWDWTGLIEWFSQLGVLLVRWSY